MRIDSGNLGELAARVRQILDQGGLADVLIVASGGIGEEELARLVARGVPIDGFGIGTELVTSSDAAALDCAYKLQEYAGMARRKRSSGKETWPGRKQVWRHFGPDGALRSDTLGLEKERYEGEALLLPVMRRGRSLTRPSLLNAKTRLAAGLKQLPAALRRPDLKGSYPVVVSSALQHLTRELDRRLDHSREIDIACEKK